MSNKKTFRLVHDAARKNAKHAIDQAPDGDVCTITEPKRNNSQNAKIHAMLGDLARSVTIYGRLWTADDLKRLLADQFARDMAASGTPLGQLDGPARIVPSLDGSGVVQLGVQTREFSKAEGAAFIEYLLAFGAEHEVKWSEGDQGYEALARGKV